MKNEYIQSVSMSGIFKYIDDSVRDNVYDDLRMAPHKYSDGEIIYHQGEDVSRVAIVHSGLVKGERIHDEGTSHLAYLYGRGDLFAFEGAFSSKHTSPLQLTAVEDTTVVFFDIRNIFESHSWSQLTQGIMELLANDDIKKLYRIEILSRRSIRGRIMAYFQFMASRQGSDTFRIDMSREQLSQYLCVNRTALSNEINVMKREGLIDFKSRNYRIL